jgi:hypothetical protein
MRRVYRREVVAEASGKGGGGAAAFMGGPTYQFIGLNPVQGEDASRHHGIEAKHVFVAQEVPGLFGRALALCSHQDLDSVTRPGEESAAVKSEAAMPNLVRGSKG